MNHHTADISQCHPLNQLTVIVKQTHNAEQGYMYVWMYTVYIKWCWARLNTEIMPWYSPIDPPTSHASWVYTVVMLNQYHVQEWLHVHEINGNYQTVPCLHEGRELSIPWSDMRKMNALLQPCSVNAWMCVRAWIRVTALKKTKDICRTRTRWDDGIVSVCIHFTFTNIFLFV